jgi:nicotinate-nucleotide adenylyltransferase
MRPIGVFGGTFDPIHLGHLRTAFELLQEFQLTEIRFVPCRIPHREKSPLASAELRLRMVRESIESEPGFRVDERELNRDGPSYSVDTLESLCDEFPDRTLALIIGMDAFLGFTAWHRWQDILRLAHIIVAHRPGSDIPGAGPIGELLADYGAADSPDLLQESAGRIFLHAVTQLEISSSAIRQMVRRGADPRFLIPGPVARIIGESGCYSASSG